MCRGGQNERPDARGFHYTRRALPLLLKAKYGLTDDRGVAASCNRPTPYRVADHKIGNGDIQAP